MKPLTKNLFKARLGKQQQIGFFATLGTPSLTELLSGCGFDWALIDTEHSPIETPDVIDHLRAIEGAGIPALVRLAWNDMVLIKRILDQGAQTLQVKVVEEDLPMRQTSLKAAQVTALEAGVVLALNPVIPKNDRQMD